MGMVTYYKTIDEIQHWTDHVTLNVHGEPLLHKNIIDMVVYAKKRGLAVSLLINAKMSRPETTRTLCRATKH